MLIFGGYLEKINGRYQLEPGDKTHVAGSYCINIKINAKLLKNYVSITLSRNLLIQEFGFSASAKV